MLKVIKPAPKSFAEYQKLIDTDLYNEIIALAKELKVVRILHLNSTSYGGGVAEILTNLVPLLNDLGLKTEWQVMQGEEQFFELTKSLHDAFQEGHSFRFDQRMSRLYQETSQRNAQMLEGQYDIIVAHDPQPLAIPYYGRYKNTKFIWRSHIDTSCCPAENWSYFQPFLTAYHGAIFTTGEYIPADFPIKKTFLIPPAIDPFCFKNREINQEIIEETLVGLGLDLDRPIVTQVSRLDPWKDPIGVIKAYLLARETVPGLQLVLAAQMALDDPEGWKIYTEVKDFIGYDHDVHLVINDPETNDINVNSLQSRSDVIIQKSIREGFGLTVTEGMWKSRPVIGGDTVGIRLQIKNNENGYLVHNYEECAEKIIFLLKNREVAERLGAKAKESVRANYLMPRLIRDHLKTYLEILAQL